MIKQIALTIIIVFGLFGMILLGTLGHELIHAHQYREVAKNDYICLFPINATSDFIFTEYLGYYHYEHLPKFNERVIAIDKYSEFQSYAFNVLIAFIFISCAGVVIAYEIVTMMRQRYI